MPDDLQIRVEGLDELRKALRQAHDRLAIKEIGKAGKSAADIVAQVAKTKVPVRTGAAAGSVRAVVDSGGGAVKGGGAKAEYFGWLDFGGRVGRNKSVYRTVIKGGRYLYPALAEKHDEVLEQYENLLHDVLHAAGLI